ncbi:7272_t:CDS:2 [Dentiscutata erythropus]|uniref:7272_t:CDS:1 n=1 Tax=Dentiscutata erythropus TaxID=1348616 RepID=A0A9N9CKB5_9GLOM|nr:7272_t:CDS:2 [Dentiscutata erythropus]
MRVVCPKGEYGEYIKFGQFDLLTLNAVMPSLLSGDQCQLAEIIGPSLGRK